MYYTRNLFQIVAVLIVFVFLTISITQNNITTVLASEVENESGESSEVEKDSFYALLWDPAPEGCDNLEMPFILRKKEINQYGLEVVANNAYQHLKNAPKGRKAIFLAPWRGELNEMVREEPEDYIWWDNGINKLANLLDDFLTYYRRLGGDVDIVFGDIEAGTSIFYLEQKAIWPDPTEEIFDKIVKNPRYKTELRPALIEASKKIIDDRCKGYIFPTNPNMNELYWVYNYADASYDDGTIFNHIIFNYVMTEWNHIALNKAIFEPFKKHFPNIKYSNYNSFYIYKKYVPVDIYGSIGKYDTEEIVGTHGAPPIYGSNRRLRENPPPDYPFDFL